MSLPAANVPPIRYARSGDLAIAYQEFGSGPVDVLLVPGFVSHIEYGWQEPLLARFLRRLSGFARVIAYDKRGMGLSDRAPDGSTPSLDQRVDDIRAVLAAVGSTSAALLAWSEGGPTAIAFGHRCPELTRALLLLETTARFTSAPDFEAGVPADVLELFIETMQDEWGSGVGFELYTPSLADDQRARAWWASYQRVAATPGAVTATLRQQLGVDVRHLLPDLTVPTLVFHRTNDMVVPVECGRALAAGIPGARLVEQAGDDHMYWVGHQDETLDVIRACLADASSIAAVRRRGRPAAGWESLTPAELDVTRFVAAGWTNRQIAERLFVSPRTVQTHMTHVLAKLGLQRRSEVAVEAARHSQA